MLTKDYGNAKAQNYINKTVIIVLCSVSDSLGGIANLTQFVIVSGNTKVSGNSSLLNETWNDYRNSSVLEASFLNLISPAIYNSFVAGIDANASLVAKSVLLQL